MAEISCNQLLLILLRTYLFMISSPDIDNAAMSLYEIIMYSTTYVHTCSDKFQSKHKQNAASHYICNIYSTVGRSIFAIYAPRQHTINIPPRSYIEGMDRPTVLYILYTTVSAEQTTLLPENASQNNAILVKSVNC